MTNTTIARVHAASGTTTPLLVNTTLAKGEKFRLIGREMTFMASRVRSILNGTVPVVDGVSECGKFETSARVCDTTRSTT